jgi:mandelate racemase
VTELPALTVRSLRVRPVALTPDQPVPTAAGTMSRTCLVLIELLSEEGICGRSYLRCYSPLALAPLAVLAGSPAAASAGRSRRSAARAADGTLPP